MKKLILICMFVVISISSYIAGRASVDRGKGDGIEEQISDILEPRVLDKYSIDSLSQKNVKAGEISIVKTLDETPYFTSYQFSMEFFPALDDKAKQTTGMINLPSEQGKYPLVIMIRGYVDQDIYQTGVGTRRAGEEFAKNGYITIAPDFLGYAESDSEAGNIFETRFQTYTTVLALLSGIDRPGFTRATADKWDGRNVFIWAHSNGGQIALTTLAITQEDYPTTLWAPVTKPFPYSVLYYTDESVDGGKYIRKELSALERVYDTNLYSFTNYLDRIKAPIQLHQGTNDDAIPVSWSTSFVQLLSNSNEEVEYFTYPGADHNLTPGWDTVVSRDLEFFENHKE